MKGLVFFFCCFPCILAAQQSSSAERLTLEIRSSDSTRQSAATVRFQGNLVGAVGARGTGEVTCRPAGCVTPLPAVIELTTRPGSGDVSVSTDAPELEVGYTMDGGTVTAFGHKVSFDRDSTGRFRLAAPRTTSRPKS